MDTKKKILLSIAVAAFAAVCIIIILIFPLPPADGKPDAVVRIEDDTDGDVPAELFMAPEAKDSGLTEDDIYTFLQGPRSFSSSFDWSGEWAQFLYKGNSFGGFGCGLCCIANIYDTLSPYRATPLDAFDFARANSDYYPTGKVGAIYWDDLLKSLRACGMTAELGTKPDTIEKFRKELSDSASAIVLIQSADEESYWGYTPGHYVNIWLYDDDKHTVFLANPGNPEQNRTTISDETVYDYLKMLSDYQVLYVRSYNEDDDNWKNETMTGFWNPPADESIKR